MGATEGFLTKKKKKRLLTARHGIYQQILNQEQIFFFFTRKIEHPREKSSKYQHLGPQQNAESLCCHPEVKPLMDKPHPNTQRFQRLF